MMLDSSDVLSTTIPASRTFRSWSRRRLRYLKSSLREDIPDLGLPHKFKKRLSLLRMLGITGNRAGYSIGWCLSGSTSSASIALVELQIGFVHKTGVRIPRLYISQNLRHVLGIHRLGFHIIPKAFILKSLLGIFSGRYRIRSPIARTRISGFNRSRNCFTFCLPTGSISTNAFRNIN